MSYTDDYTDSSDTEGSVSSVHSIQHASGAQVRPATQNNPSSLLTTILGFPRSNPKQFIFFILTILLSWKLEIYSKLATPFYDYTAGDWATIFQYTFVLRYTRLFCNIWGSWRYEPSPVQAWPKWTNRDVTVILPTIDPGNVKFVKCIISVLENRPAAILIVTVGAKMRRRCEKVARRYKKQYPSTRIGVSAILHPSKRRQVAHAVPHVDTEFTILADDHVYWPSTEFIPSVLAPFEDNNMGVVATYKRVLRTTPGKWSVISIVNLIGCFYLLRHNWELRASNAIDGGVFVVSGRTAAYRTKLLKSMGFMDRFCRERFFFGLFGGKGLGPDDDNFLTREAYRHGWKVKFQQTEDSVVETSLGDENAVKFRGQLIRWARTTFRSNPCMLRRVSDVYTWRMPYTYVAVYAAALFNFALFWDATLFVSLYLSWHTRGVFTSEMGLLALWVLWTKTIKLWPHILRHPSDIPLIPCQILFAYAHSLIKVWALFTFWDCAWLGRNLDAVDAESKELRKELDKHFTFA